MKSFPVHGNYIHGLNTNLLEHNIHVSEDPTNWPGGFADSSAQGVGLTHR